MTRIILALCALLAFTTAAAANAVPALRAEHGWIRLLPAGLPSAGYVTLRNDSNVGKRLESVSSDAFGSVMLHESMRSSGMQHMRMVDAIDIPAHGQVALAPGGYHLMLMQPRQPLKVGAKVVMVLHFADGAAVSATFNVRPANASGDQP